VFLVVDAYLERKKKFFCLFLFELETFFSSRYLLALLLAAAAADVFSV
jgi:hypothetical protein